MTDCPLCKIVKGEIKALVVYEDEDTMAIVHPLPAHKGHLLVFPKEHKQIITEISDELLQKMYGIAQKLSGAVFDAFGAQGTNVLIQNGEAAGQTLNHFAIHVIPRTENDGVTLEWQPKQAQDAELEDAFNKLMSAKVEEVAIAPSMSDDNYRIKNLRRSA